MKIKEIHVEKKFNLGNFQSLGIGVIASVEEYDNDIDKIVEDVTQKLIKAVEIAAAKIMEMNKK